MSDLQNNNAKATKQGLEALESRIRDLETENAAMKGHVQNCINLVNQLQQTNALALQKLVGTGPTT